VPPLPSFIEISSIETLAEVIGVVFSLSHPTTKSDAAIIDKRVCLISGI
jgi:hypothetical protein